MNSSENRLHHNPPISLWYTPDTYVRLNKCSSCSNRSSDLDYDCGDPCPNCGGEIKISTPHKWVPPTYSGYLWWKELVTKGYWQPSTNNSKD